MFELLEKRQLMAAAPMASVIRDGHTLNVTGTNEADRIHIGSELYAVGPKNKGLAIAYIVFVNDVRLARYESKIERINVFGLGGRDRIDGLNVPASALPDPRTGQMLDRYEPAPMNIEGGSGNDVIIGGLANDTLKGGRGDDYIIDPTGQNLLDGNDGNDFLTGSVASDTLLGGSGNDTVSSNGGNDLIDGGRGDDILNAYDGTNAGGYFTGPASNDEPAGSGDTIISEAGEDMVTRDRFDTLRYTGPRQTRPVLDAYSTVLVTDFGPIIN